MQDFFFLSLSLSLSLSLNTKHSQNPKYDDSFTSCNTQNDPKCPLETTFYRTSNATVNAMHFDKSNNIKLSTEGCFQRNVSQRVDVHAQICERYSTQTISNIFSSFYFGDKIGKRHDWQLICLHSTPYCIMWEKREKASKTRTCRQCRDIHQDFHTSRHIHLVKEGLLEPFWQKVGIIILRSKGVMEEYS